MTNSWQEHIDHVTAKGVLAKRLYVIFTTPTTGLTQCTRIWPRTWRTRKILRRVASLLPQAPSPTTPKPNGAARE